VDATVCSVEINFAHQYWCCRMFMTKLYYVVDDASESMAVMAWFELILDCASIQGGSRGTGEGVVIACAVFLHDFAFRRYGVLFSDTKWAKL